ncbi:MAG: succinylglutamate desuccinylase/aspartoacylase family protein [Xanthomonadales bacterium]|nr:succinylglutamate desuccinylase/aspartoacylase family protein [Xanthomonadales bacterium]
MDMRRLLYVLLAATVVLPAQADEWGPVTISNERIAPGESRRFSFEGTRTFEGAFIDFPVFVARGMRSGPTLCVTAAIHGDEVNSVEIARRAFAGIDAKQLAGTLVVLPAVNASGFRTKNRNMPDRRDLNRAFPGNLNGSVASIVASVVFDGVIRSCSVLVDLHTGSNFRSNLPQIRADTSDPRTLKLARDFGVGIVVAGEGPEGSIRREAMKAGIPAIIYEAGPPYIFLEPEIVRGVEGVNNVMSHLGMTGAKPDAAESKMLLRSRWLRVPARQGGVYLPVVRLGDVVAPGQLLANVTDPVTDQVTEIRAPEAGVVIGMALPQVVLSGFALLHVGEVK